MITIYDQQGLPNSIIDQHFGLANRCYSDGNLAKAESICLDILLTNPDYFFARHLLGTIYLGSGNVEAAADHLSKAVLLNPEDKEARRDLAELKSRHLTQMNKSSD